MLLWLCTFSRSRQRWQSHVDQAVGRSPSECSDHHTAALLALETSARSNQVTSSPVSLDTTSHMPTCTFRGEKEGQPYLISKGKIQLFQTNSNDSSRDNTESKISQILVTHSLPVLPEQRWEMWDLQWKATLVCFSNRTLTTGEGRWMGEWHGCGTALRRSSWVSVIQTNQVPLTTCETWGTAS